MTFEENYKRIEHIPGWFSKEDCQAMWGLMQQHKEGLVVEIGSFMGRSATFISAMHNVICIDPWKIGKGQAHDLYNKIKLEDKKSQPIEADLEIENFYHIFKKYAITENEYGYRVGSIIEYDYKLWDTWSLGKIGLLHLDHKHTEDAVYNSLLNWRRHLLPSATIFIHDMNFKNVAKGVAKSMIHIQKRIRSSLYEPVICRWKPHYA